MSSVIKNLFINVARDVMREGVFAINKPKGLSSAQVLRQCQQHFNPSHFFRPVIQAVVNERLKASQGQFTKRRHHDRAHAIKIGHGGTLDPLATGVLIVGVGSGTKDLPQFLHCTKTYEVVVLFGASTDSYDRVGRVLAYKPYSHITREAVEQRLADFRGNITQIPPIFSALKMNGKPLYEYAREGKPIPREIQGRAVEAYDVELVEWYPPGTHEHRWPTEQGDASERSVAEQVWNSTKVSETPPDKMTAEEKHQEEQALAAHESFKRDFEQRQDGLIKDGPLQRRRHDKGVYMSGALNEVPQRDADGDAKHQKKRFHKKGPLPMPPTTDKDSPAPWTDEGPAACKIRLTVSSGYYVRSFCHDLGTTLGSAALMAELCRTRQSDFTVGGPTTLELTELDKGEEVWGPQLTDMIARWNGRQSGANPIEKQTTSTRQQASPMPRPDQKRSRSSSREKDDEGSRLSPHSGEKRRRLLSEPHNSPPPSKMAAVGTE